MALDRMGAASLLLLLLLQMRHTVSSAALPEQPYPDVWLTGFEPIVIDGQPVEPACKIIPIGETTLAPPTAPPTTTPAPPTTTVKSPTIPPAPITPPTTTPKRPAMNPKPPTMPPAPPSVPPTIPPAPPTLPPPPTTAPRLVPARRAPPTPPPAPPIAPRLVPARRAWPPLPTAARFVPGGWPPPAGPFKPHGGFVLVPFLPANGRAGVHRYGAGHRLVPPGVPLPGNRRLPARAPPRNLNIPAGGAFPNYALVPANPPPRRAQVPGRFLPAGRWASVPRSGLSRGTAAIRVHTSTSSDSSEEYRR